MSGLQHLDLECTPTPAIRVKGYTRKRATVAEQAPAGSLFRG
jgi:hypothetical protein